MFRWLRNWDLLDDNHTSSSTHCPTAQHDNPKEQDIIKEPHVSQLSISDYYNRIQARTRAETEVADLQNRNPLQRILWRLLEIVVESDGLRAEGIDEVLDEGDFGLVCHGRCSCFRTINCGVSTCKGGRQCSCGWKGFGLGCLQLEAVQYVGAA